MKDNDVWGIDKWMHMGVCIAIAFYSTDAAFAAAMAKEYGDRNASGNHWCWWDLMADGIGIVIGTVLRVLTICRWNWF